MKKEVQTVTSQPEVKVEQPVIEVMLLDSRFGNEFKVPHYATAGSAGLDLIACLPPPATKLVIGGGETVLIPTGIAINLRDTGLAAMLIPRSGLGHNHGIVLGNLVGLIDSDYLNQVFISCWNRGDSAYTIFVGDRIAQMVIVPIIRPTLVFLTSPNYVLDHTLFDKTVPSTRLLGGLGHTGR